MSWDIFISKSPIEEAKAGNMGIFGPLAVLKEALKQVVLTLEFKEADRGFYRDETCSIEFSLSTDEPEISHFMMYIRGGGTTPINIIKSICEQLECYAMDCSTGDQMDFSDVDEQSFLEWQAYRDKVIKG